MRKSPTGMACRSPMSMFRDSAAMCPQGDGIPPAIYISLATWTLTAYGSRLHTRYSWRISISNSSKCYFPIVSSVIVIL